jgi:hypothetical protein
METFFVIKGVQNTDIAIAILASFLLLSNFYNINIQR